MKFILIVTKTQQNNWGKNPINLPGINVNISTICLSMFNRQ